MAKEIQLTQGKAAIVDDEDFEKVNQYKWYCLKRRQTYYAARNVRVNGKRTLQLLHRFLLSPLKNLEVDHKNLNGLDNQKSNLRLCSSSQNKFNRNLHGNNKSGFKGVSWHKGDRKWHVRIQTEGENKYLGSFTDKKVAAHIYNLAALDLHKEFSKLNFIGG